MTIDPLNVGLRILPADAPARSVPAATQAEAEPSFGESLRHAVSSVDQLSLDARYQVGSLLEGTGADVHDAMIAVQKADLGFQLMLQVRNKVVQAYQQIAGMQF